MCILSKCVTVSRLSCVSSEAAPVGRAQGGLCPGGQKEDSGPVRTQQGVARCPPVAGLAAASISARPEAKDMPKDIKTYSTCTCPIRVGNSLLEYAALGCNSGLESRLPVTEEMTE